MNVRVQPIGAGSVDFRFFFAYGLSSHETQGEASMTDFRDASDDSTPDLDPTGPTDLLSSDEDNLEELPLWPAPRRVRGARSARSPRASRHGSRRASERGTRHGVVRVDAWSEPAPVSWSRTRRVVRKVRSESRGADWALPF